MPLPINVDSYSYRFLKNLNKDVKLKSDRFSRWDIDFDFNRDDWVIVDGYDSVVNACIIAIMTRFDELEFMELYDDFGCRVHELIKANHSANVMYKMELFISETLSNMRRVKKVNWVEVSDTMDDESYSYKVVFNITCIIDEDVDENEFEYETIEEGFLI